MSDERQRVIDGLAPMYAEARARGLWFHCSYQDLWFSPDELAAAQTDGRFLWGACNWTLRDPEELVDRARDDVSRAREKYKSILERVGKGTA